MCTDTVKGIRQRAVNMVCSLVTGDARLVFDLVPFSISQFILKRYLARMARVRLSTYYVEILYPSIVRKVPLMSG